MGLKYLFLLTALGVPGVLRAHEASIEIFAGVDAGSANHRIDETRRFDWQLLDTTHSAKHTGWSADSVTNGASRQQCSSLRYKPTWWLNSQVELRRAVHFEIMASIAWENGIPANLLDAVISQESGYNSWAISSAGAMGMMQIMPGTARVMGLAQPFDPIANMRAGARYLREQISRFGRIDLALAAYNAGPERRSLRAGYIPAIPETRNYVRTITTNWLRLTQLERPDSAMLARAAAASTAVQASGYREVSLVTYDGMKAANPI